MLKLMFLSTITGDSANSEDTNEIIHNLNYWWSFSFLTASGDTEDRQQQLFPVCPLLVASAFLVADPRDTKSATPAHIA